MPAARLPGPNAAAAIAFVAGAGVLSLEITGARSFIPWFGSSVLVWSNIIGVTLGAVAVGNLLGGRVAHRRPSGDVLAALLAGAGLLTAAAPFLISALAARYLPSGLKLETAYALIGRGSLVVAIASLGPPLLLLGAASPLLVRGAADHVGAGRAAGRVSGAGTLGSLLGTWLPVYVLIPSLGSRATLLLSGAALLAAAAIAWGSTRARGARRRGGAAGLLALVLTAIATQVPAGVGRAAQESGGQVLEEAESRYQYLRVERTPEGAVALRLNEGLDSFHSLTYPGEVLTGAYFDYYGLFVPATRGAADGTREVLILGFAAGTIARQLLQAYPAGTLTITGVELDPAVTALGPRWFELPESPRLTVISDLDARTYLETTDRRFDLIVVDTFADQVYMPFQMCSREFFARARERLRPGGVLTANLSGFSLDDAPVRAVVATACDVFGEVSTTTVAGGRNFVLAAGESGVGPDPRAHEVPSALDGVHDAAAEVGAFRRHRAPLPGLVLTDDRSPIELLSDRDLRRRAVAILEAATGTER